jgi:hypothetical protein
MSRNALVDAYLHAADRRLDGLLAEADADLRRYEHESAELRAQRAALWKVRLEEAAEQLYLESWNAIHARMDAKLAG